MQRWIQSAAGGTSQRLKPAAAIVRSLSRIPPPPPTTVPALLIVVILASLQPLIPERSAVIDPVVPFFADQRVAAPQQNPPAPGSPSAFEILTPHYGPL